MPARMTCGSAAVWYNKHKMLLLRWIINALALILVAHIVPGFTITSFYTALIAALVLGLINATIRWVILVLTLPLNILTLGLFTLVVNAGMILLASSVVKGFTVTGFGPAFMAALALWIISLLTNWFIGHEA